jgi:hypothetical protein
VRPDVSHDPASVRHHTPIGRHMKQWPDHILELRQYDVHPELRHQLVAVFDVARSLSDAMKRRVAGRWW